MSRRCSTNQELKRIRCAVYARVVGYYRPTTSFNDGKLQEWMDRALIKIDSELLTGQQHFE